MSSQHIPFRHWQGACEIHQLHIMLCRSLSFKEGLGPDQRVCACTQYESNSYYVLHHSGTGPYRRITTYFTGAFLSAIFNLLLIIFLGTTAFELQPLMGNRRGAAGTTKTGTTTTGAATV